MKKFLIAITLFVTNSAISGEVFPVYSTGSLTVKDMDINYLATSSIYANFGLPTYSVSQQPGWADPTGIDPYAGWISFNKDPLYTGEDTFISYTTTFDTTGFDVSTIDVSGKWAASSVAYLYFNQQLLQTNQSFGTNPTHLKDFTLPLWMYESGVNRLDFVVFAPTNTPTGVLVSMQATSQAVPEPGSIVLIFIGLAVGLINRKRMQKCL